MDSHKRLLAILHIVYGTLQIVFFVFLNLVISTLLPLIEAEMQGSDEEGLAIVKMVFSFLRSFFVILILFFPLPSIIGGIAQLNNKSWGLPLLLISGCLGLLNLPIGTALGVYTLWVYLENQKEKKAND